MVDFIVASKTHLTTVTPLSRRAQEWFESHVQVERWQRKGASVAMNFKLAQTVMGTAVEAGFTFETKGFADNVFTKHSPLVGATVVVSGHSTKVVAAEGDTITVASLPPPFVVQTQSQVRQPHRLNRDQRRRQKNNARQKN